MVASEIWVYLERDGQDFEEVSLEILGAARDMADRYHHNVTGIILGNEVSDLADTAVRYGADRVIFLKNEKLDSYGTELYTSALHNLVSEKKPDSFLFGATNSGRDLAARLAARLRTGLAANVVTLDMDDKGTLFSGVPGYGSKVIARIVCVKNKPQMSTVRGGIFQKHPYDPDRNGHKEIFEPDVSNVENAVSVISRITRETKDITGSERVIIAGNGAGGDISLVEKLGQILQADIGATRPMADKGLYPRDVQVGSTGISLKADYALVLGSSGSEHFITGIANCKKVISIDINPKSDIFEYSDYCVVGDISKILPEIIKKMEEVKQ